jgi:uncharacterized 2Fe-2S/4Fe-4S cluster protein (DUF4445 family)
MATHLVTFDDNGCRVPVPTGTLLVEAARLAGIAINQPCGGQGRCGRCAVQVLNGGVRRRSTLRLKPEDVAQGYALACQSIVECDTTVIVPPQEAVERRLVTDRIVSEVAAPADYNYRLSQNSRRFNLTLSPPSLDDQTDDWSRLQVALRQAIGESGSSLPVPVADNGGTPVAHTSLRLLRGLGRLLRQGDWQVTAVVDGSGPALRLVDLQPGHQADSAPLWGTAVDIGTTTVTVWLVDLVSGRVAAQTAEYNRQIACGEDVISRIVYAGKNGDGRELRRLVLETINELVARACYRAKIKPEAVVKATIAGNSSMIHLLLGLPAETIRLAPFVTAVNEIPLFVAGDVGLAIHPDATVDCLPGVASYVGADISAGALAAGLDQTDKITLFLDIGTNGEMALGNRDWLVACACSAGPAFEGAGVGDGMRAARGAIEEVWIHSATYEASWRVIGAGRPRGICGSGLLSLLAELFVTGLVDKAGNFNTSLRSPRLRQTDSGWEYVVAWGSETDHGRDISVTRADLDNLLRAKAAIYAGFTVLGERVGVPLEMVEQVLIGGAFGKYVNVEKAVQIGLLPDMPWESFHFLGNTSVQGAYLALLDRQARRRIGDIAARMTYVELSADNTFYDAFTSALFLPHTDLGRFPSVANTLEEKKEFSQELDMPRGGAKADENSLSSEQSPAFGG